MGVQIDYPRDTDFPGRLCGHSHQLQMRTTVYFTGPNPGGANQAESQCILFIHCMRVSKPNFKSLYNQIHFPIFPMEQGSVGGLEAQRNRGAEKKSGKMKLV